MQFVKHTLPPSESESSSTTGIFETPIQGLYALPTKQHRDDRGFFGEIAKIPLIDGQRKQSQPFVIKQMNHAHSTQYVTRGFHTENWNKLITVTQGVCFVAIADTRPTSTTFGHVLLTLLGQADALATIDPEVKNRVAAFSVFTGSLFLPSSVANSVCVLTERLDYLYAVDKLYEERDPAGDTAISLFDQQIGVDWPITPSQMIMSQRDKDAVSLS